MKLLVLLAVTLGASAFLASPADAQLFGSKQVDSVNSGFSVGFVDTTVLFLTAAVIILLTALIFILVLQGNTRFLLSQTEKKIEDKAFDIQNAIAILDQKSELDRQVLRDAVRRQTENAALQDAKDVFQTVAGGQRAISKP